jgi:AraC-like DNA-binding protein
VALHHGIITLESQPEQGSTFHIYLPLPEPEDQPAAALRTQAATLWFISNVEETPAEIVEFGRSHQLVVRRLHPKDDLEALFADTLPAVVAWNISDTQPDDWVLIRRLHNHPQMAQIPFILFQEEIDGGVSAGLTSLVVKPAGNQALWDAIRPSIPGEKNGSVLIIDDDEQARRAAYEVVSEGLPEYSIRTAVDGESGLAAMLADPPSLVILDLMMPKMDGFEVLDQMRADERTWSVPVIILSNRQLSMGDIKRLEQHTAVTLQSKEILSDEEIIVSLHRAVFGSDTLPLETSTLVKQAIAYIHENYGRSFGRSELAENVGMSEDYLGRVFKQELGISPWDYLNRYRIYQARKLLLQTHKSVSRIAKRVGFSDPAYFSRVFRKHVGRSPSDYRTAAIW